DARRDLQQIRRALWIRAPDCFRIRGDDRVTRIELADRRSRRRDDNFLHRRSGGDFLRLLLVLRVREERCQRARDDEAVRGSDQYSMTHEWASPYVREHWPPRTNSSSLLRDRRAMLLRCVS